MNNENYLDKLKELSKFADVNLFKKKKNNWILKDTRIIMNECNKLKKKKIKDYSTNLKQISNDNIISSEKIKKINNKVITDIDTLDSIINIVQNNDESFIEVYSN
jgi:esterase/lipase